MSAEEMEMLERLIDMLGQAGEGAFWILMAWVAEGYFGTVVTSAVILGIAYAIYKTVTYCVSYCGFADDVRREAGCEHPWGAVSQYERNRVLDMIRRGRGK